LVVQNRRNRLPVAGRTVRLLLWGVLALGGSLGAATWTRLAGSVEGLAFFSEIEASRLHFDRTIADFGTVFTSEAVEWDFGFHNTSDQPIRITDVEYECGCLEAVPSARWIPSGGRGSVRAKFATQGRFGPQAVHIRVRTDEGPRTGALLKLRGTVHAVLRPSPPRVFLGDVLPGEEGRAHVGVEALEPIADLALATEGKGLAAELEPGDEDQFGLRVVVRAPASVGTKVAGVRLRYMHVESGRRLEAWIPVVWTVPPPLELDPTSVELAEGRATLRVRSRWPNVHFASVDIGTLPLSVTRSALEGGEVQLEIVNTGASWEIPYGAVVRLVVEPKSIRPIEVPLFVSDR
jgi:hypothetical protein